MFFHNNNSKVPIEIKLIDHSKLNAIINHKKSRKIDSGIQGLDINEFI